MKIRKPTQKQIAESFLYKRCGRFLSESYNPRKLPKFIFQFKIETVAQHKSLTLICEKLNIPFQRLYKISYDENGTYYLLHGIGILACDVPSYLSFPWKRALD